VLVAPLMPGINDAPVQVAPILEMASEAGAAYVTGIALHLRGEVRGLFFEWLEENRPDLLPLYKRLYRRGAYAPPDERRRLEQLVSGPDRPSRAFRRGRTREPPSGETSERTGHGSSNGSPRGPEEGSQHANRTPEQGRLF
jgi:DNA repair photolyase